MITVIPSQNRSHVSVLIQANLSISAESLLLTYAALTLCSLLIATVLTLLGYWPVLVFAVIHQLSVGWLLWLAWRSQWTHECIIVAPEEIQVIHRDRHGQQIWRQHNSWARIEWVNSRFTRAHRRLLLCANGMRTEIGTCLNDAERQSLSNILRQALTTY